MRASWLGAQDRGRRFADLDLDEGAGLRWKLDVDGHCARPDVFRLTVYKGAHPMLSVEEKPADDDPHQIK